ncbi:MAG: hypothetical protein IIX61_04035 [Loktanella sp.]|nr:hypothetical protein [Loktanella sp.]
MSKKNLASATRTPLLTMLSALALTVTTSAITMAEEMPQSWVPDVLAMPDDIEVLTDREIGGSLRMFSVNTAVDVDELLAEWEEALRMAGYTITQAQGESLDRVIEFSGQGISNAKIAVTPSTLDDLAVIEFDATLQ